MPSLSIVSTINDNVQEQQSPPPTTINSIRVKAPRRILHFSDGTLEEYSTDDEPDTTNNDKQIDVKSLEWGEWFVGQVLYGGNRLLAACDFVGEKVAAVLGITTPKYSYEIEQFKKIQKQHEKEHQDEQSVGGWMQQTYDTNYDKPNIENSECIMSQEKMRKY